MHWCLKWTCQLIQHWLLNDIKWNERKVCCGQIEFSQARISSKSLIESLPMTKLWNIFYAEKMILVNRWYKMPDRSDAIFDSLNLEFKIYGKVLPEDETRKNVHGQKILKMGLFLASFSLFLSFHCSSYYIGKTKFTDDWIRPTEDLLCLKRPLYQLSHNLCPQGQKIYL